MNTLVQTQTSERMPATLSNMHIALTMKIVLILCVLMTIVPSIQAQGISINEPGTPPHPSAILDIQSTSKGVLIPRMTMANRTMISSPAAGLLIYQTDGVPGLYMYEDSSWEVMSTSVNVWSTAGNGGTDPENAFIGTTDNTPLRFRVNNKWAGEYDPIYLNLSLGDSSGVAQESFYNTSFGHKSLKSNQNGVENTAVGYEALARNGESNNTAVGFWALRNNMAGYSNTAIGNKALEYNVNGYQNTALGRWALNYNLTGNGNTGIGYGALSSNTAGNENVAIGSKALFAMSGGHGNIAIGASALENSTTSGYNVAIGLEALKNNTQGYLNTGIGAYAMKLNTEGYSNCAIGYKSLESNIDGYENDAFGTFSLWNNISGYENVAVGTEAMAFKVSGSGNTAVGNSALGNNVYGSSNTAVGKSSLLHSSSNNNTSVGFRSMIFTTTGTGNTAMGYNSLESNNTGTDNVSIGSTAMKFNTVGIKNTAVGTRALYNNSTGDNNIAIGYDSGTNGTYYNTVSIGNHGWANEASNQVFIGNLSSAWIGGCVGWSVYSDARIKTNVQEDVRGLDFITRLRPVTYYRKIDLQEYITGNKPTTDYPGKYDVEQIRCSGFLAQEVEKAAQECGYDFNGVTAPKTAHSLYSLSYESFVVPLVKGMQEQQTIIEQQQDQISKLELRLLALESLVQK